MNPPRVYTCSPCWSPLPPPSPYHPSGSSECTSPKHPVSCIEPGLVIRFIYDIIRVSMPFSKIIPPSPSPTESKCTWVPWLSVQFSSVQSLSHDSLQPHETAVPQVSLSVTSSQNLLKLMSIELVMPSKHHILCHPLFLLPSIFPIIWILSSGSVLHIKWPNWHFSLSISPSNEYSGLIIFTIDWLDLLAVQGTLKGLLQHHSSKASIIWHSAFFMVQLSHPHPYMNDYWKKHSFD